MDTLSIATTFLTTNNWIITVCVGHTLIASGACKDSDHKFLLNHYMKGMIDFIPVTRGGQMQEPEAGSQRAVEGQSHGLQSGKPK